MKAEEKAGNSKFRDFSQIITDLRQNFTAVAGELSKSPEFNPLTTYKEYWNTYFNYESHSLWLRQAYQANAEYQLKRSFSTLAVYYNIGGTSGGTYDQIAKDLLTVLTGMDGVPLGPIPTEIKPHGRRISVYSSTLNRTITTVTLRLGSNPGNAGEPKFTTETLQRLVTKCHGRTIKEDMQLAGIWSDDPWDRFDSGGTDASDYGHGLGFNTSGNSSKCYASLIDWKGNVYEKTQTYNKWATFRGYDGQNQRRVCYVYFTY